MRRRFIHAAAAAFAATRLAGCTTGIAGGAGRQFVASEQCAACHKTEYPSWKASWHAKMVRPA